VRIKRLWKIIVPVLMLVLLLSACAAGGTAPEQAQPQPSAPSSVPTVEVLPERPLQPVEEPETVPAPAPASPEEAPAPQEETPIVQAPQEQPGQEPEQPTQPTCTISISCATILNNLSACAEEKKALVPSDGWVLQPVTVPFYEDETVFNVLQRTCKQQGIHFEFENTPMYQSAYIEGIGNLYEFDVGPLSGWMYRVNGWFPNYGCSRHQLKDGDNIEWIYTCDLGRDVGGENAAGNRGGS